jgi:hypothetical protein
MDRVYSQQTEHSVMMRNGKKGRFLISLCTLAALLASVPSAAAQPVTSAHVATDAASLSDRVDRLAARLQEVETEVAQLRREKQAVQQDLDHQKQEAAALKAQLTQPAASPSYRPSQTQVAADKPAGHNVPGSQWGTRVGYQDFPYGQQQGGFFYSFFFDHRLFSQEEGIPLGDVSAEINVGIGRSGNDKIPSFSSFFLQTRQIEFRQTMLSGWIGIKYHLNYWAPYGVRPYVVAGPGIWGDVIESPPLFIGQQTPSPTLAGRKLPVDAAASLYPGGQGGGGFEISLARTHMPFLQRVNLGFDYRYSAWSTGERFATYSFSLAATE